MKNLNLTIFILLSLTLISCGSDNEVGDSNNQTVNQFTSPISINDTIKTVQPQAFENYYVVTTSSNRTFNVTRQSFDTKFYYKYSGKYVIFSTPYTNYSDRITIYNSQGQVLLNDQVLVRPKFKLTKHIIALMHGEDREQTIVLSVSGRTLYSGGLSERSKVLPGDNFVAILNKERSGQSVKIYAANGATLINANFSNDRDVHINASENILALRYYENGGHMIRLYNSSGREIYSTRRAFRNASFQLTNDKAILAYYEDGRFYSLTVDVNGSTQTGPVSTTSNSFYRRYNSFNREYDYSFGYFNYGRSFNNNYYRF